MFKHTIFIPNLVMRTFAKINKIYMSLKAIVIGANGLIGSQLVSLLIEQPSYTEVLLLVRRPLQISHSKVQQLIVNFDNLKEHAASIQGDIIFSCLGTTRNKSPEPAQYKKVDLDYPLEIAQTGLLNGVKSFHIVTSLGADSTSRSPYLKLKGELENALKKLPFQSLHIYQPSYLVGNRTESRIDDKIMRPLMRLIDPVLMGNLKKYKSMPAETLAKAMVNQSLKNLNGIFTYPSNQIKEQA